MKMKNISNVKPPTDSHGEDLERSTRKVKDKQLSTQWTLTLWASHLYLEATIRNALNLSSLQTSQNCTSLTACTHR